MPTRQIYHLTQLADCAWLTQVIFWRVADWSANVVSPSVQGLVRPTDQFRHVRVDESHEK
jgi:hypothetical protein